MDEDAGVTSRRWLSPTAVRRLLATLQDEELSSSAVLPAGTTIDGKALANGALVFASTLRTVTLIPPLRLREGDPLVVIHAALNREATVAVLLLRLGRYAVGVFHGRELATSKTDTRYVGGQHKAGGWSQKRFSRIREKQARELYDKACEVAKSVLGPREGEIETLWLGGDRHVLNAFTGRCPWLNDTFAGRFAERRLATPVPSLAGLKSAIDDALRWLVLESPTVHDDRPSSDAQ
jgi:Actinobacteria/chloroflexi VLRF1 release factor